MFEKASISLPTHHTLRPKKRSLSNSKEILYVVAFLALLGPLTVILRTCHWSSTQKFWVEHPANATLGFGAIYAVSKKGSPRREWLLRAASLTSLDVTIPAQPMWKEEEILSMRAPENSTLTRGSALAWMGHLNALTYFLSTNDDTALIIEDDVDWDTRIRTQQIPQTAHAVRELVNSREGYYGKTGKWDIMWLGHCGDYFNASRGANISTIKSFIDPSMPAFDDLHPWTQEFMDEIGAKKDHQRLVHPSVRPLCSFAYAVTRSAASRLLNELAFQEPLRDQDHPCGAYDVRLLESCRDEGLNCITVNPELFHHTSLDSEIEEATYIYKRDENGGTQKRSMSQDEPKINIRCSARSRKWMELRTRLAQPGVDPDLASRELAESDEGCAIDGM